MNKRTTIRLNTPANLWPVVEKWAGEDGYRIKQSAPDGRTYQKSDGLFAPNMMLKLTQQNQETILEAWVGVKLFIRIQCLFLVPAEMGVESGGFRGVLPRKIARKAINKLLADLQQLPIQ